jgi:hypothetical protein
MILMLLDLLLVDRQSVSQSGLKHESVETVQVENISLTAIAQSAALTFEGRSQIFQLQVKRIKAVLEP